jgi:predicted metal-dependent hydrolase
MAQARNDTKSGRTTTPADLQIQPRDIAFGRDETHSRWWLGGDPVATAFYNALSVTFPQGERFFMDSVRNYRDRVSEPLKSQIGAFITQEAMHSREHVAFNNQVTANGYDITAAEARLRWRLNLSRKAPQAVQLAATAALEHFTAILAHALLSDPRHLEGASPEAARMWRWHAMEEIEHKAVAFDTFHAGIRAGRLRRWMLRSFVMVISTFLFSYTISRNVADFFHQDGINNFASWRRLARYLFVEPGLMSGVFGAYRSYYRPGFHPWQEDDRHLLPAVQAEVAAAR